MLGYHETVNAKQSVLGAAGGNFGGTWAKLWPTYKQVLMYWLNT